MLVLGVSARYIRAERTGPLASPPFYGEESVHMVTPAKFMLALIAGIAMLVVIGAMVLGPDTGHFAGWK